ncbi:MAG: ACP S-malonyltransferase [Phycisphaerales bacterium]|jgi:[acyl-carrier-protein] S-malonyltransferase
MSESVIVLCPGQGSQAVGMGRAWADASDAARKTIEAADAILAGQLGAPLSALCFDGPAETLNRTDVSQPAIYICSIAAWRGMAELGGEPLDLKATAGLSLGEYTALHLAGVLGFEEGLRLVTLRGRAMQDAAEATPGGMLALIGCDEEQANDVCQKAREDGVLVCANFNAPGQVVLSGDADAIERAQGAAKDAGLRATPLPVAGAFHSPLMEPAADRLAEALAGAPINAEVLAACPVYSNVTAKPHEHDADSIRRRLAEQLTHPVRWAQGCQNLLADLAAGGQGGGTSWHELAPGKSLAGMMKRIDRSVSVAIHDAP